MTYLNKAFACAALFAIAQMISPISAHARSPRPDGIWEGTYQCAQGQTGVTLVFEQQGDAKQTARFRFYSARQGQTAPSGEFVVGVHFDETTRMLQLRQQRWVNRPSGYHMIDIDGTVDPGMTQFKGRVITPGCGNIVLSKTEHESASPYEPDTKPGGGQPAASAHDSGRVEAAASANSLDLAGDWLGVTVCERATQNILLSLKKTDEGFSGTFRAFNSFEITLRPQAGRTFSIISPSRSVGKSAELLDGDGVPGVLTFPVSGGCSRVFALRHEPIGGLGGLYAEAADQKQFCGKVVDGWLGEGRGLSKIATAIKEEFYPLLAAYDADAAPVHTMMAKAIFTKYFGQSAQSLNLAAFHQLENQIKGCLLLKPTQNASISYDGRQLYVLISIEAAKLAIIRYQKFSGAALRPVPAFGALIANRQAMPDLLAASDVLKGWEQGIQSNDAISALENFIRAKAAALNDADPEDAQKVLAAIGGKLKALRIEQKNSQDANIMARNQKALKQITIPYEKIETRFHGILRELATGKPVQFDGASMLFLGGMAQRLYKQCHASVDGADLIRFVAFLKSSAERAALGADYSNPNLGLAVGGQLTGLAIYQAGDGVAGIIGCDGRTAQGLVELVVQAINSKARTKMAATRSSSAPAPQFTAKPSASASQISAMP